MERSTFVYDGDCAFCTRCVEFVERRIPTGALLVPWQFADLDALGLTAAQCSAAVQWVGLHGQRAAGPDAIARLLGESDRRWRLLGALLRLPPVRLVAWPVYRWVAANRHRMPGGTAACALPAQAPGRGQGGDAPGRGQGGDGGPANG